MADTRLQRHARRRHRDAIQVLATELRNLREDAGLSQSAVARAADLDRSYLSLIEAGRRDPTLPTLHALAAVLGCDLSVRLFPNSGPAIRDRFQARILEALLRLLHPRWTSRLEVPVHRPARGVIDAVLAAPAVDLAIATEIHSDLRRVEQQLRWAHLKADALVNSLAEAGPAPSVSRLLVLRSTTRTRLLAHELATTFATEFPADPAEALAALTSASAPWPGPTLLFATVHGSAVRIFARPRPQPRPQPRSEAER